MDLINVRKTDHVKMPEDSLQYLGYSHLISSCAVDPLYMLLAYKTTMVVVTLLNCVLIYHTVLVKVHWSFCKKGRF